MNEKTIRIGHLNSRSRVRRDNDGLDLFTYAQPISRRGRALRTSSLSTVIDAFGVPGVREVIDWSHLGPFNFRTVTRRRVAKMTRAKARMRWNVVVAVGNKQGLFGVGLGTSKQMRDAYMAACKNALLNMTFSRFVLCSERERRRAKVNATKLEILPRAKGTGLVANRILTSMAELVGLEDVSIKVRSSSNPLNVAKSFYEAVKE